jgi:hypothetical protein
MNETWITATDHFPYNSDPVEAGRGLGEMYLESPFDVIDFWSADYYNRSCLDAFLDVLDGAGLVQNVRNMRFMFHVAPGPEDWMNLHDYTTMWIDDYLRNVKMRERLISGQS